MAKNPRSKSTDNPSIFFYIFVLGLVGYFLYKERHWFTAHIVPLSIIASVVVTAAALWLFKRFRLASTLTEIDRMGGHEFEKYLVRLFKKLGFQAKNVGSSGGDFGADLIIQKDGIRIAVQAKNYLHGKVGNDAVQQAIAGATYHDCHQAMVVTNARYTKAAREQARGCAIFPVTLWDRKDLHKALKG